jgi:hypothetical protein
MRSLLLLAESIGSLKLPLCFSKSAGLASFVMFFITYLISVDILCFCDISTLCRLYCETCICEIFMVCNDICELIWDLRDIDVMLVVFVPIYVF